MNAKICLLGISLFALVFAGSMLQAAEEPLQLQIELTQEQQSAAREIARAIIKNRQDAVERIFNEDLVEGLVVYDYPSTAIERAKKIVEVVQTALKTQFNDMSLQSLKKSAGLRFTQLIAEQLKELKASTAKKEATQPVVQKKKEQQDFKQLEGLHLPDYDLANIVAGLSDADLNRFGQVSRQFHAIAKAEFETRPSWLWKNGKIIPTKPFHAHERGIAAVFVTRDGNIVSVGESDPRIYVWEKEGSSYKNSKIIIDDDHTGDWSDCVHDASFSIKTNRLALFRRHSDRTSVWDVQSGKKINMFRVGLGAVGNEVAFSPDGTRLAVMRFDGYFELLDVMTGIYQKIDPDFKLVGDMFSRIYSGSGILDSPAFSPDGRKLTFRERETEITYIWDLETNKQAKQFAKNAASGGELKFLPDGTLISYEFGIGQPAVLMWDVQTGKQIFELNIRVGTCGKFRFSHDGKLLACCLPAKKMVIWHIK